MKRALVSLVVFAAFAPLCASGAEPDAKREAWLHVRTQQGNYQLRVDGGPPKQEAGPAPKQDERWKHIPNTAAPGVYGFLSPDKKHMLYAGEDPETRGEGKKPADFRHRLMIADAEGKKPRQLFSGLKDGALNVSPDGKTVVFGAERNGKWDLYRVTHDGTPPVKISQTPALDVPEVRFVSDGRFLYMPVAEYHSEPGPVAGLTIVSKKGPVILTDGKTEAVLLKAVIGHLPEIAPDGTRMARAWRNEDGDAVVEITELKTGKKEEIPLKAFSKVWKCQFTGLVFRPDSQALAVRFSLGNVVIRENGPLPGDEAIEHVGVIWLDGRKDRTALFRVSQPADKNGHYHGIGGIEWLTPPPSKK